MCCKGRGWSRKRERDPNIANGDRVSLLPGMMLHIDGSHHQWFQDDRWYDLIVILDDATSEIYYAQLVDDECTRSIMAALRHVVENQGWFASITATELDTSFRRRRAEVRSIRCS